MMQSYNFCSIVYAHSMESKFVLVISETQQRHLDKSKTNSIFSQKPPPPPQYNLIVASRIYEMLNITMTVKFVIDPCRHN